MKPVDELEKKTNRLVITLLGYSGVCHDCGSPQTYGGEITAIVLEDEKEYIRILPVNVFVCGHCGEVLRGMKIYKSLEVTKEMSEL